MTGTPHTPLLISCRSFSRRQNRFPSFLSVSQAPWILSPLCAPLHPRCWAQGLAEGDVGRTSQSADPGHWSVIEGNTWFWLYGLKVLLQFPSASAYDVGRGWGSAVGRVGGGERRKVSYWVLDKALSRHPVIKTSDSVTVLCFLLAYHSKTFKNILVFIYVTDSFPVQKCIYIYMPLCVFGERERERGENVCVYVYSILCIYYIHNSQKLTKINKNDGGSGPIYFYSKGYGVSPLSPIGLTAHWDSSVNTLIWSAL